MKPQNMCPINVWNETSNKKCMYKPLLILHQRLEDSLVRNNQSHCTVTAAAKNLNAPKCDLPQDPSKMPYLRRYFCASDDRTNTFYRCQMISLWWHDDIHLINELHHLRSGSDCSVQLPGDSIFDCWTNWQ